MEKKKRWTSFYIGDKIGIDSNMIESFNISTEKIIFKDKADLPDKIIVKHSYMRDSGKQKIVTQSEISPNNNQLGININEHLINYDLIFAIDTNNKKNDHGDIITGGAVVYGQPWLKKDEMHIGFSPMLSYYFRNLKITPFKPERFVWYSFIKGLASLKNVSAIKIAIIVDSELGLIPKINSGTEAIWNNFYLPPFIDLIYASSDKKNDSPQNKMIHDADKYATEVCKLDLTSQSYPDNNSDYSTILVHENYKLRENEEPSSQYYIPITKNFLDS